MRDDSRTTAWPKHAAFLLFTLSFGCAHGGGTDIATLASNSDQVIWEAGQKALEKKQWENARQYFKRIVEGFPQSEYGPACRLALGDSYLREGGTANIILAISEYREFLTLYPSHPKSDYAQFQVAEGFFRQRNGPDRDQTPTTQALEEYQRLLDVYPSSSHLEQARARIVQCRQSLAEAEFKTGFFYQRTRKIYRAAVTRYQIILSEYPDYARVDEVLFRLAESLTLGGRPAEALPHLEKLLEEYPQSRLTEEAKRLRQQISLSATSPPTSPTPPPGAPQPPAPSPSPTPSAPSPSPAAPEALQS